MMLPHVVMALRAEAATLREQHNFERTSGDRVKMQDIEDRLRVINRALVTGVAPARIVALVPYPPEMMPRIVAPLDGVKERPRACYSKPGYKNGKPMKPGRKPKAGEAGPRLIQISLRATEEENTAFREVAKEAGMELSDWARKVMNREVRVARIRMAHKRMAAV